MALLVSKGGQTLSVLQVRKSQYVGDMEDFSGYILKSKNIKLQRNSHGQLFNEWITKGSLQPDHFGCALPLFTAIQGYLLRQRRMNCAALKEYDNILAMDSFE